MRFWDRPPHVSPEDTAPLLARLSAPGDRLYFVWEAAGEVIGTGGLHAGDELGFILHPDHWGKGFAKEALSALVAHVWATTAFDRITAEADPRNLASVGLLTRLGFRVSGYRRRTIRVAGEWSDSIWLELPKPGTGA